jgi:hypothetical protein
MISKDGMMNALVAACPTFEPGWRAFLAEWQDEPVELPLYVALGDFARHLISMLERDETSAFPEVFQVIETLHIDGDSYVKEAATIGILESLQNANEPDRFRHYLGPESQKWWVKLNRFWDGDATALRE